jgi:hypothetical protein
MVTAVVLVIGVRGSTCASVNIVGPGRSGRGERALGECLVGPQRANHTERID